MLLDEIDRQVEGSEIAGTGDDLAIAYEQGVIDFDVVEALGESRQLVPVDGTALVTEQPGIG